MYLDNNIIFVSYPRSLVVVAASLVIAGALWALAHRRGALLKHIRGPPSKSWIFGHMRELLLPTDYGDHEYKWQAQYGTLYKVKGCFGEDRLLISDPAALKFVLNNTGVFVRSTQQQHIVRALIGEKSLFFVNGNRLRNIMNPAFATVNIRALTPLFYKVAHRLIEKWESAQNPDNSLDVFHSIHDATLDAIGEAAMGYSFYSNGETEYAKSHNDLTTQSSSRTKSALLADALLPSIPDFILRAMLNYLPSPAFRALRLNRKLSAQVSEELMSDKTRALELGLEAEKDLLTILVRANIKNQGTGKLTGLELSQQIPTVVIAGQGATANTIAWALYELAKNPEYQQRLREEIVAQSPSNGAELSYNDLEGMPHLNAFLKEILRVYAGLPLSERIASRDTVIPLAEPIITTTGERIDKVAVKKGQFVVAAIASYHRLTSVWGPDAAEFKPSRWLEGTPSKGQALGPYANLLTFFGGPRVCIGWRFAVTEMQVMLTELIRRFYFRLPRGTDIHIAIAVTVVPVPRDGDDPSLPLVLRRVE